MGFQCKTHYCSIIISLLMKKVLEPLFYGLNFVQGSSFWLKSVNFKKFLILFVETREWIEQKLNKKKLNNNEILIWSYSV